MFNNSFDNKLPRQAAPVARSISHSSMTTGADASGFFDILKSVGQVALPIASQLLGSH
jgi:hypothetical protein